MHAPVLPELKIRRTVHINRSISILAALLLTSFTNGTQNYLNSEWTNDANAASSGDVTQYPNTHTTDVTNKKALDMIDEAASDGKQFFMMVAGGT